MSLCRSMGVKGEWSSAVAASSETQSKTIKHKNTVITEQSLSCPVCVRCIKYVGELVSASPSHL